MPKQDKNEVVFSNNQLFSKRNYLRKCLIEKRIIVLLIDIYDPLQRAHDSYEFLSKYFVLNWFYGVHLKARVFVI